MPAFTPPAANAVDFAIEAFTPPASTAVDFDIESAPPVGPVVTSPMGPSNASGVVPTGALTSDIPRNTTNGAFLRLDWITSKGTLRRFSLPHTP